MAFDIKEFLLENEQIITSAEQQKIVLTNSRIRQQSPEGNNLVSIMLDNIDTIQVTYHTQPLWLLAATLGLFATFWLSQGAVEIWLATLALSIIAVIIFFVSRKHQVRIAAATASIQFETKGLNRDAVLTFVNQVEQARLTFIRK
jgi:hypothetical protein